MSLEELVRSAHQLVSEVSSPIWELIDDDFVRNSLHGQCICGWRPPSKSSALECHGAHVREQLRVATDRFGLVDSR